MTRAFITGIAGFAGSHLAEQLLAQGFEVHGATLPAGGTRNIDHLQGQVRLFLGDLGDAGWLRDVLTQVQPDMVFHLIALGLRPRVLVIGSADEYGLVRPDELPIRESNPLRPNNPYAVSKIAQDYLGYQYFLSHGLPVVRLRPFRPPPGTGLCDRRFRQADSRSRGGPAAAGVARG